MIVECNFLSYDADDFHENKIQYNDDTSNAPPLLVPGAIDESQKEHWWVQKMKIEYFKNKK